MKSFLFFLLVMAILSISSSGASAQQNNGYVLDKTISIPGNGGYDYLSIDDVNHHLFVSHGTCVDVIDLATETLLDSIGGMKGVHGIAIVNEVNKGFISDGKTNAVTVFDLSTLKTIVTIQLSGKKPDAIVYDPFSKRVFAFCGDDNKACVIDIHLLKEVAAVSLPGAPEFAVPDGNGLLYNNLEDKNSLAIIDTKNLKVAGTLPLAPCGGPTGLALDKMNRRAFSVCRQNKGMSVIDINRQRVVTTVPIGAGVDAVVYDSTHHLIVCSNGDGTATVIQQLSADDYKVVQTLPTSYKAKTMALDKQTGKLYFSAAKFDENKKMLSDSFRVLVYRMNAKP